VGVIGCGYWGPQLVRNLNDLSEGVLVGVADQRPERLDYVRQHYPHVRLFSDHTELLASDIEAVVIATPIRTHYELARQALQAGKHVLVEKPLATRAFEAAELIRLAEATGRTLMVGHTFLYNPAVEELRRIVQSGELGRIYYVDSARLSLGLFQRDVNVLWDLAPHDISILFYILGSTPLSVSAHGRSYVQPNIHDVAYVEMRFANEVGAHAHLSWLNPSKVRRMTVVGDRKMLVYDDVSATEPIRIYDKGVDTPVTDTFGEFRLSYRYGEVRSPYISWQEPLKLECEHFLWAVQTGSTPKTDGVQGLQVVATLEAANYSLANGGMQVPVQVHATSPISEGEEQCVAKDGYVSPAAFLESETPPLEDMAPAQP
jgi:predicted dehydrogenase